MTSYLLQHHRLGSRGCSIKWRGTLGTTSLRQHKEDITTTNVPQLHIRWRMWSYLRTSADIQVSWTVPSLNRQEMEVMKTQCPMSHVVELPWHTHRNSIHWTERRSSSSSSSASSSSYDGINVVQAQCSASRPRYKVSRQCQKVLENRYVFNDVRNNATVGVTYVVW